MAATLVRPNTKGIKVKITIGDTTIAIEPGDDPSQVVAMAKAIAGQQDMPKPAKSTAATNGEAAPTKKSVRQCSGHNSCEGLYHCAEQKHHSQAMCETYEYVASFKHGRSSNQVASWAGISVGAAYHRLVRLNQLGLTTQEGRLYVAS